MALDLVTGLVFQHRLGSQISGKARANLDHFARFKVAHHRVEHLCVYRLIGTVVEVKLVWNICLVPGQRIIFGLVGGCDVLQKLALSIFGHVDTDQVRAPGKQGIGQFSGIRNGLIEVVGHNMQAKPLKQIK